MSQLEDDIYKRIEERLRLWVSDSFDLHDMAGIDEDRAVSAVISVLFRQLVQGLTSCAVEPEEAGQVLAQLLRQARRRRAQRRAEREEN